MPPRRLRSTSPLVALRAALAPSVLVLLAAAAMAEAPAVARAHLRGGEPAGAVFFLPVPQEPGAVAVGSAHAFDATRLAESGELVLRRGGTRVGRALRYFAAPGRAYHRPGATLRDDYVVFALETAPEGVRLLEPAPARPAAGARVRILGLPSDGGRGDAVLQGTVAHSEDAALEVDLDARVDLRGWGGAPVVDAAGRAVGLLESAWPHEGGLRTGVAPLGGVLEALDRPFEGGIGRLFATLAPPPSAATDPGARRRAATGSPFGDPSPTAAARVVAAATRDRAPEAPEPPAVSLEIEHPPQDAVVGEAGDVFVAGRATALRDGARRLDVMIVIDTSASTAQPTGVDVDEDGVVGTAAAEPRSPEEARSSDPGDSILAAEVAAARALLPGLDARATRVGLVTFAGDAVQTGPARVEVRRAAITEEPLTSDYDRLGLALGRILARGPSGSTHMAAGVDQASLELLGLEGSISRADPDAGKVTLFFTDGTPTLPHPSEAGNVRAVLEAALRARRAGVRIHAFAIGPEALAGPIATVEMAAITGGLFTPVRRPGTLARFMELVGFARIESLEVENATTGEAAHALRMHPDGSWDALVPLAPGPNELVVRARAALGPSATRRVRVTRRSGREGPTIPAELLPRRTALLERRLEGLRRQRAERMRKELVIEMERERAAALRRAERQRKELEIEPWRPPEAGP